MGDVSGRMGARITVLRCVIELLAVLFMLLPQAAAAQKEDTLQSVALQLPWFHQFQFAGYYAAVEKGYYKDAGLDVSIKEGHPGLWPVDEVVGGRIQYGVARSEVLLHYLKGEPVVALAAVFQHSAIIFLARKDSGIASPQDMIGRRLMLLPGNDAAEHKATLFNEGVALEQLEVIPSSFDIKDLINGKTDVFNAYISNEPFYLKEHNVEATIIKPSTYGIDFYGDTLFTSRQEVARHPQQVKAFREASLKGWVYAMAHKEEIISLLKEKYGVKKSLAHLHFEADALDDLVRADLVEVGHMNPGRWQHMADTYVKLAMAAPGYSLDSFIYDSDPRPDYLQLITAFYLLLAVFTGAAVALLLLFNRKLSRIILEKTTSLEETREALSKKEEFYRFLFDNAPVGISLVDEDGTVREVNNEVLKITGYSREDAMHIKAADIYSNADDRAKMVKRLKKDGMVKGLDLKMERRDGSPLDVRLTSVGIIVDDRPHVLSLLEDVSKVKEMERERSKVDASRQRMQKMEAIGLMAGGVAHDLNNILSGIVSYPELLLMQIPDDSPLRKSLTEIHKSGQRAAAVVADLLTVARGVASVKEPHDVNELLAEYLDSPECQHLKELHAQVAFSSRVDPDLFKISCSPVHVKKSLMNLITNAAEAIEGAGCVNICTRNEVAVDGDKNSHGLAPGHYVVVTVSDTGPGISEKDKEHVFEPFYTRKVMGRSGTGLGLAVVWNTMQDHNGAIALQSSDKGTVFELFFPACFGEVADEVNNKESESLEGNGETVLVIDDEFSQRDIASQILESLGYKAQAVSSGEEAVEYLRDKKVELLLLDMIMAPKMNGHDTYAEIIKIHPGQKAVLCSGFSRNDVAQKTHALGAGGFLKKPYTRNELGRAVQQELRR